ncbi:hypothetical protein FFJ24_000425 [Pedobacter sp. KBS0701]|uniref:hypothetical protein n=1 Tax=Pedobacter sp. KBS0701 TaxID=2578106 RepID=UPI00110DB6B8|nr:hypothetical protein [Pedobacter sp. KBS0701]QDW23376.1 hypothetical protein FFJ24_000425 [Pedobacter sp. KBS0701]
MSLTIIRVLFFCLVPIGVFILVKAILMLKGIFNGEMIVEIPFTQKEVTFEISRPGIYAIWQKGKLFRRTPVDKFQLKLSKVSSGENISLPRSIFSPRLNGFDTGRMEMNRFRADIGSYCLNIVGGSSVSSFEKVVAGLFPAELFNYNEYFIQVRESRPMYDMVAAIPMFILAGFCIFGGIVAGITAPDIVAALG